MNKSAVVIWIIVGVLGTAAVFYLRDKKKEQNKI